VTTGTFASVTEASCTCRFLEDNAANPDTPVRFDPDLNEYSIVWSAGEGYGAMMIYHCPFCGGRTPKSRRDQLFAEVSDSEYQRLHELTANVASVDDALRILGKPSREESIPPPKGSTAPTDRNGNPTWPVRFLTFSDVSKVAEIQISVKPDNKIEVTFGPKYTGPGKRAV
jgi:hypothetical protein